MKELQHPEPLSSDELFKRHAAFVARFLRRLGVEDDALDDCVQEVFLVVHRRGGYLPGPAKPTSYLGAIALHTAAEHRRRRRVHDARDAGNDVDAIASLHGDPARCFERREQVRVLQRALEKLDPTLQTTLLLADGEGDSCVSIAAAMKVPLGTVYWRLSRARKKFRLALRAVEAAERGHAPPSRARAMAVMLLGDFGWRGSAEAALLRTGSTPAPDDYDVAGGLVRHRWLGRKSTTVAWSSLARTGRNGVFGVSGWSWPALGACAASVAAGLLVAPHPLPAPGSSATAAAMEVVASPRVLSAISPPSPAATEAADRGGPSALRSAPTGFDDAERRAPAHRPRAQRHVRTRRGAENTRSSAGGAEGAFASAQGLNAGSPDDADAPVREAQADPHADGRTDTSEPRPANDAQARASAPAERLLDEAREIARAERLLSRDPHAALAVIQRLRASSGSTYLREECDYVEVMALHKSEHDALARERGRVFLRRYPTSAFAKRVASTVQDIEAHAP